MQELVSAKAAAVRANELRAAAEEKTAVLEVALAEAERAAVPSSRERKLTKILAAAAGEVDAANTAAATAEAASGVLPLGNYCFY